MQKYKKLITMKTFKQAPLPFQGQKWNFIKHFKQALKDYPSDATYVDLFGGSGLLSHTVKSIFPNTKVIYNDYDNFRKRLKNIPQTNAILDELRSLNISTPRGKRITGMDEEKVLTVLKKANKRDFVDWVSLSSSLKFAMNYGLKLEDFTNDTLYNKIKKSNYDLANDYLKGIEVMQEDYRVLYEKYSSDKNVIFLIDPPYLSTDSKTYKSESYWKLSNYLDVIDTLKGSYFYFTSNKSHIVELANWVEKKKINFSPFKNATCVEINASVTHNAKYTDIMYHKNKTNE